MPARAKARQRRVREDDARRGVRPDSVLAVTTGVEALAGMVLKKAVRAGDRDWLCSPVAKFWSVVAGLRRREFVRTLEI